MSQIWNFKSNICVPLEETIISEAWKLLLMNKSVKTDIGKERKFPLVWLNSFCFIASLFYYDKNLKKPHKIIEE